MKVPANLIESGKYTTGGEFVFKNTNTPYKGYYYILNNSYFIGKDFNVNAEEIIKIQNSNQLLSNSSTFAYSFLSGVTSQQIAPKKVQSVQSNIESDAVSVRYFVKKINISPIIIKEVNKDTYDSLKNDPFYQTTYIGPDQNIDQANTQLPGLKAFLLG